MDYIKSNPFKDCYCFLFEQSNLMMETLERISQYYETSLNLNQKNIRPDVLGYNIPIKFINEFRDEIQLSKYEEQFIEQFDPNQNIGYLIALSLESNYYITLYWALYHEMSHALYYLYPKYRENSMQILLNLDKDFISKIIQKLKYFAIKTEYFNDELIAYSISETNDFALRVFSEYFTKYQEETKYPFIDPLFEYHTSVKKIRM